MYRFISLEAILFIATFFFSFNGFAGSSIKETRVWPSPEYTRITIESNSPLKYTYMNLTNPERIVVDLNGTK